MKVRILAVFFAVSIFLAPAKANTGKIGDVSIALNPAPLSSHTVTVNVTYDFSAAPGCATGATTGCVKQFNVYTISGTTKTLLFSIAAPAGASTSQTVTGTSPSFTPAMGNLTIGVTAATPDGIESSMIQANVPVPPPAPIACNGTIN